MFRKAIEYQAEYKKKGRRPQKKKHVREKIHRATLKFIHDFLTSEEQQQGVAYGTVLVKKSDGAALRIAKVIRRQHTEVLVRQLRVLLKENKMQKSVFEYLVPVLTEYLVQTGISRI